MRCVSYTRAVSCMESGEIPKDIISQQNQRIQDYIKKRGWTLGKKYSDRRKDAFEETAYLQMKMDAIAREFDCVVMDSMFRCGRNSNVASEMLESMFVPAGIHFAVVEDDFCSCDVSKEEVTEFKVTKEYIKLVRIMQDKMIAELACKGIGIETNPSSNYLIGTIKKYEEHPILRFNSRKLKATNTGENLCVSINTDDQGVFDTLLENEYALMTLALKKATDDDMNALYDIEDIYEWSDYVRRMGIDQVFS